jgi:hypothetical protein
VSISVDCAVGKNESAPFSALHHTDDFIKQEVRRPIHVPEITGFLKNTPGNLEGLLYQFTIGHAGERLRSCHVPRAKGDRGIDPHVDYESTRNVGLIANILLGSIMRIADQHPRALSAHKVTEEQK